MNLDALGQLCALLTALAWGGAIVLFKRSGERVPPLALNLFKNVVGLVFLAATLLGFYIWNHEGFEVLAPFDRWDFIILIISGILGIAVADTLFFHALNLVGVGMVTIVECAYSPLVFLCSWLMLYEEPTWSLAVGAVLVLAGVFISSRHKPPVGRTRAQMLAGILLGTVAMGLMAIGIVMATPVLKGFPVIWATTFRLGAGSVALAVVGLLSAQRQAVLTVFRPSRFWGVTIPAALLGTYISLVLWIAGFKYAEKASVAAVLNQTSVIFALVFAAIFLKEELTRRKVVSVILAMTGVLCVTLDLVKRLTDYIAS